jgi:tetratricopeptide (TPR) repeat protein
LVTPFLVVSQTNEENKLSKAIQLFDKGNFADAEPLFKKILDEKPADFMVNYFYGACRTENNHFTNSDLDCLILANQEVSPININYYFGVQYHARSNWERALKFYNKYKSTASLSESEKQKISEKIQQCYDKINPYEEFIVDEPDEAILPGAIAGNQSIELDSTKTELENKDSLIANEALIIATSVDSAETEIVTELPKGESIIFNVNSEITYLYTSQFKTEDGLELFVKGDSLQKVLDFSLEEVNKLREEYSSAKTREEKNYIGEKILTYENDTYQLKNDAPKFLIQAKRVENEYWENATPEEIEKFKTESTLISEQNKIETVTTDSMIVDTTTFIDPNILFGGTENIPSTNELNENDLIYKIQIGAFSRGVPSYKKRLFDKLSLIRKIEKYTDEKGVVVYTTGNLTNYDDAVKMKNQVKQEGIKDARIVPYLKGKRITLEQAIELQ